MGLKQIKNKDLALACFLRRGLLCNDRRTDDAGLGLILYDLHGVALQRAHLHHLLQVVLEHRQIEESHIEA